MISKEQKERLEEIKIKFRKLKESGWSEDRLTKLLINLDLPLGAHLNVLRSLR
jgi:hypothetical protein